MILLWWRGFLGGMDLLLKIGEATALVVYLNSVTLKDSQV